ncbi:MAG: hypothetical protein K9J37_08675 [Saprospiraceae bacterium]|nr:hypothetical protein [Saprospiraceae bacterium]MCF8249974.1 hypothetical protein [Saprospiraceae bacterium]MCF8278986.1 hypothetical protein [Bacteroidales bacterium]MCF8310987.1 hypothetical protein [Saprospiraceae bacterium]MCF8439677.1 hypothetical protein [Saprospiraceae bacterium]
MQQQQTHIIGRQILEVEVDGRFQSWEWHERLSRFANGPLNGLLAEVFDQVSTSDKVIRLDHLELSADMPSGSDWEEELLAQIGRQLVENLSKFQNDDNAQSQNLSDGEGSLMTAFFYFLEKGRLPWWASSGTAASFEGELLKVLENNNLSNWTEKFNSTIRSTKVRQRLVGQFSEAMLGRLAVVFLNKNEQELLEIKDFEKTVFEKIPNFKTASEGAFWRAVFEKPNQRLAESWQASVIAQLASHPELISEIKDWPSSFSGLNAFHFFAKQMPAEFEKLMDWAKRQPVGFETLLLKFIHQNTPNAVESQIDVVRKIMRKMADQTSNSVTEQQQQTKEDELDFMDESDELILTPSESGIFIRNAGMVILWPFLQRLFDVLGIAKDGELQDSERAICLLQYLATGTEGDMEHELPLNKLLCGVPLEKPQSRKIQLTTDEKTTADNLLQAVISHWAALGNSTADGLRGTFLCREGKLTQNPVGGWLLRVEQRSFDVLLAKLPWSISMIKLPWMPDLITVEWS